MASKDKAVQYWTSLVKDVQYWTPLTKQVKVIQHNIMYHCSMEKCIVSMADIDNYCIGKNEFNAIQKSVPDLVHFFFSRKISPYPTWIQAFYL